MAAPDYFIPDRDPRVFCPLRSFLRAPPVNVAAKYIDALTAPGDLVVDPFGARPNVARAALALNRRVVVVESNPLWAWLARALATLPPASEIDAALARLGDTLKDDTPLRVHINQLYATICAGCNKPTPANHFIRTREGGLIARHYTCTHCGATRDDSATEDDLKRAEAIAARGMHYYFALERVVPAGNLHVDRIRKMLDVYTPRNLYALVTLTQKIEARFHATRERESLLLLLLHLLERGTNFYGAPETEPQLTAHKQFVEFNLWREMELAARALAEHAPALELAESLVDVLGSPSSEAFIGRGNAKALAQAMPGASAALVLATPPTRRVAVWALAYFWGAWILGRSAVRSLAPFLDTAKDATWEWRWYADMLDESSKAIAQMLRADARAVFVFSESWHQVIEWLLLAAAGARLQLESFLFQPRVGDFPRREFDDLRGEYRLAFDQLTNRRQPTTDAKSAEKQIRSTTFAAASDVLTRRGEALGFSWVHHAALVRIARQGLLERAIAPASPYGKTKIPPARDVHNAVIAGLQDGYAHDLDHFESKDQFLWLRRSSELDAPLIDRVDEAVREILSRGAPIAREELEDAIYRQFPGDQTPEAGLIELCAAAHAALDAEAKTRALDALEKLGERLGYIVKAEEIRNSQFAIRNFDLVWQSNGEIAHAFVWRERAQFSDLAQTQIVPTRGYIIVPENLVALMCEKTRRLPHLAHVFHEAGWDFVRVPFVEKLLAQDKVEPSDIALMVGLIPPIGEEKAQLELL